MPWQNKQTIKPHQELRSEPYRGFFCVFSSRAICLVFAKHRSARSLQTNRTPAPSTGREVAEPSVRATGEEQGVQKHRAAIGAPQSHRTPVPQPPVRVQREREQREGSGKPRRRSALALSGEGVKKTNRNQPPPKDKHSTEKLQGKFKHWGPRSRKLVTWVTSWNFTAKYPFFFLIWKDKLLAFLNNFSMFNGWKLSSNCSAYWIKC